MLIFFGNPTQLHSTLFRSMVEAGMDLEILFTDEVGAKSFYNHELAAFYDLEVSVSESCWYRFFNNVVVEGRKGIFSRNNSSMFGSVFRPDVAEVIGHAYDTLSAWYTRITALI